MILVFIKNTNHKYLLQKNWNANIDLGIKFFLMSSWWLGKILIFSLIYLNIFLKLSVYIFLPCNI
jgi:hypothetical protein